MLARGVDRIAISSEGSTRLPSSAPSFMNAITKRDRSSELEKIDPAGQLAALSAAGRITTGLPSATSCPCAIGQVIAMVGRRVLVFIPRGPNNLSLITSAYGLPL